MNGFEILFHKKPITKTEILEPSFFCFGFILKFTKSFTDLVWDTWKPIKHKREACRPQESLQPKIFIMLYHYFQT